MSRASPPSITELKQIIENDDLYNAIKNGAVEGECSSFSYLYNIKLLEDHNVDNVMLSADNHMYLAVETCDEGIVIFDPTFRQFYPSYPDKYFLGNAADLVRYVRDSSGSKNIEYFFPPKISLDSHGFPTDDGSEAINRFTKKWRDTLRILQEATPTVRSAECAPTKIHSTPSSNEVSP